MGGKGCGQGRVLQLQWGGMGGDPPNGSWGQTHIWGLSIIGALDNRGSKGL